MRKLAYAPKAHQPGSRSIAVYFDSKDGPYLGDVHPVDERGLILRKQKTRRVSSVIPLVIEEVTVGDGRAAAWQAHPAGKDAPLAFRFASRNDAANALAVIAEGPPPAPDAIVQ